LQHADICNDLTGHCIQQFFSITFSLFNRKILPQISLQQDF